jgi:hypothetical protein
MNQEQQTDYKKLYLEQKIAAIGLELQLIQARFKELNEKKMRTQAELHDYLSDKKEPTEEEPHDYIAEFDKTDE